MTDGTGGAATPTATARAIAAWVAYDWAFGAFTTVVTSFVFAAYFTRAVAADPVVGAAQWSAAQALAGLVIALLAVPLGAVADAGGRRRGMLAVATGVMVVATAGLWFARPGSGIVPALPLVALATVAFEVGLVFYNAMLPALAAGRRLGRLSMLAWGAGYAGGLCCLVLCLVVLIRPDPPLFGLDRSGAGHIRATALLAAGWIALFGWPACVFVPDPAPPTAWRVAVRAGARRLSALLLDLRGRPAVGRFLLARLLYTDGLTTLFAFGGIYAAGTFGLSAAQVLLFGIGLNVSAGLGAAGFALIEDRIGQRATILVCLLALIALGAPLLVIHDRTLFWGLGIALGTFVGPAQAAGRSLMARLAPRGAEAGYFGLLALSGRVTGFAGPLALGAAMAVFGSQRAGMAVIVAFLAAGAVVLATVRLPAAQP
jgi:UMF1 family MFS transporter